MAKRSSRFNEKNLCTEIVNSLLDGGAWAYKVPDQPVSYSQTDDSRTRFNRPRQCDIIGCHNGRFIAIEAKLQRGGGTVKATDLRDVQRDALDDIDLAGGAAYVAVGWRFKPGPQQAKRFSPAMDRGMVRDLCLIPWSEWVLLEQAQGGEVSWEAMQPWAVEWAGGGRWKIINDNTPEEGEA